MVGTLCATGYFFSAGAPYVNTHSASNSAMAKIRARTLPPVSHPTLQTVLNDYRIRLVDMAGTPSIKALSDLLVLALTAQRFPRELNRDYYYY